eukprot:166615-Pyramimonas_sp.AAC.1
MSATPGRHRRSLPVRIIVAVAARIIVVAMFVTTIVWAKRTMLMHRSWQGPSLTQDRAYAFLAK